MGASRWDAAAWSPAAWRRVLGPAPGPAAGGPARPRWRGLFHQYACAASVAAGGWLVFVAAPTPRAAHAAGVYALTLVALFGVSGLYHRVTWSPRVRGWLRRIDHATIFLLLAGTYTPFAVLVIPAPLGPALLAAVWACAAAGLVLSILWVAAPRWIIGLLCTAMGWVSLIAAPALTTAAGARPVVLLAAGGALYTVGALTYVRRWPDPAPGVFGYHEFFHLLVVAAAGVHFAAVLLDALPRG